MLHTGDDVPDSLPNVPDGKKPAHIRAPCPVCHGRKTDDARAPAGSRSIRFARSAQRAMEFWGQFLRHAGRPNLKLVNIR
ncbi:hypothetical protein Q4F19_02835 [Sphingomonas sp. BIUV-7]|uniref:Uncharacterized protein n=1 Tax=Sphingomonas natans TaxID=3063330 RepID=A0ABT8Y5M9_9SPHN|nr:hypothetical protein [Sphingomonas sp. BIUV-7]MDO6413307.1 hypothetical protein [Sphingomonas sp. BIUV-7]